jgi:hypothetical protein
MNTKKEGIEEWMRKISNKMVVDKWMAELKREYSGE